MEGFIKSINNELDLKLEASNCSRIRDNFKDDKTIYIPKICWEFTFTNMITLEWIEGDSLSDIKLIKESRSQEQIKFIARNLILMFFNQAYRDGFFHADLHPGNIIISKDNVISLVDFGIVCFIPVKDRIILAKLINAFLNRDYKLVAVLHKEAGYINEYIDINEFSQSLRAIIEPVIGMPIKNISIGMVLEELLNTAERFGMETQPQLVMLQKTILVIEGSSISLDKDINIWDIADPWIKSWVAHNMTPESQIIKFIKRLFRGSFYMDKE
ncbi:MAG TPA: AarF/UbiB family protein [Candidatus Megaira endosymbiont of Hartmannula sinica]|nr:AarF/UbiB family protein [Candidatus Megaera endosymbiont of Hartmannula sinica]